MRETRAKPVPIMNNRIQTDYLAGLMSDIFHLLVLAGVVILWVNSLAKINPQQMNDFGLVSVLPLPYFLALAFLTINYLIAVHHNKSHTLVYILHIVVLIFILHGTPQIIYGTLRYSWAWKHVGIVDYIQRHGSVNPLINNLNAYHNWPGFFALTAFFNQVAGLQSSLSYAGWGPAFFNLLDVGALLMIYKRLTLDRRLVLLSMWLFYLFSWVGQDYFSPQAFTYFLYLVTFAILFRFFRVNITLYKENLTGNRHFKKISSIYQTVVKKAILENEQVAKVDPRQRIFFMGILVLILFVIAASHQLTPLMLLSGLTLLVVFQVINQRFLPLLMGVATVVWVIFLAVGFLDGNLSWVVRSIGSFFQNINGNLLNLATASTAQQMIARVDRGLSLIVWILGFVGLFRRYRHGHWDLLAVLLMIAPLPMLVLNAYGGEMLFRVYLFSLPFITFLAAGLFYPHDDTGTTYKTPVLTILASFMLIPGFLLGYYGKERMYYFSPNEVAAAQYVFSSAPKGALIVDGTWDWPRQYVNYEQYNYVSIVGLSRTEELKIIKNPVDELSKIMDDAVQGTVNTTPAQSVDRSLEKPGTATPPEQNDYPTAYLVITRSQIAEADMTGILPSSWLANLPKILSQSKNFSVVFSNPDAVVIQFIHAFEPGQ